MTAYTDPRFTEGCFAPAFQFAPEASQFGNPWEEDYEYDPEERDYEEEQSEGPSIIPVDPNEDPLEPGGLIDALRAMGGHPPRDHLPYEGPEFGLPPLMAGPYALAKWAGATEREARELERYYSHSFEPTGYDPKSGEYDPRGTRPRREATPQNVIDQLYFGRAEHGFHGLGGGPYGTESAWGTWNDIMDQARLAKNRLTQLIQESPEPLRSTMTGAMAGKVSTAHPGGPMRASREKEREQIHQAKAYANKYENFIEPRGEDLWRNKDQMTQEEWDAAWAERIRQQEALEREGKSRRQRSAGFWNNTNDIGQGSRIPLANRIPAHPLDEDHHEKPYKGTLKQFAEEQPLAHFHRKRMRDRYLELWQQFGDEEQAIAQLRKEIRALRQPKEVKAEAPEPPRQFFDIDDPDWPLKDDDDWWKGQGPESKPRFKIDPEYVEHLGLSDIHEKMGVRDENYGELIHAWMRWLAANPDASDEEKGRTWTMLLDGTAEIDDNGTLLVNDNDPPPHAKWPARAPKEDPVMMQRWPGMPQGSGSVPPWASNDETPPNALPLPNVDELDDEDDFGGGGPHDPFGNRPPPPPPRPRPPGRPSRPPRRPQPLDFSDDVTQFGPLADVLGVTQFGLGKKLLGWTATGGLTGWGLSGGTPAGAAVGAIAGIPIALFHQAMESLGLSHKDPSQLSEEEMEAVKEIVEAHQDSLADADGPGWMGDGDFPDGGYDGYGRTSQKPAFGLRPNAIPPKPVSTRPFVADLKPPRPQTFRPSPAWRT